MKTLFAIMFLFCSGAQAGHVCDLAETAALTAAEARTHGAPFSEVAHRFRALARGNPAPGRPEPPAKAKELAEALMMLGANAAYEAPAGTTAEQVAARTKEVCKEVVDE